MTQLDIDFKRQDWPFYWITQANGLYIKRLETALKENGLDVPRWRVLMLLGEGRARSISYLAVESISKLSTMTRIIQRMEADGLVTVRQRESDARVTEALLTGAGKEARLVALAHALSINTAAFAGIEDRHIQTVNTVLSRLMDNLRGEDGEGL